MKKRILSIALTLCMAAGLLAGCGGGNGGNSGSTSGGSTSSGSTANTDSGDVPTIKIAYSVVFPSPDEQAIEDELNKIMVEKAGAKVDLVGIEFGNWATQLNLMLTGGGDTGLDLFSSFWYTPVANLAANGQAMALDEVLASDGQGILDLFSGDMADYLKCGAVDGKQYGIPSMYAYCTENEFLVRTEDARAANVDWSKVNSLEDMKNVMLELKAANPDKYFVPGSTETYWMPKSIDYLGDTNFLGVLTNPTQSTTVENYYESDYFTTWLGYVKEWKAAGVISPDPLSNNNASLMNLLQGVCDGTPGYNWDADAGVTATAAQNGIDLEGTGVTKALSTTSDVTTYMWHISSFCSDPAAAMRVLNVLYTDADAAQLVANGVEGLEYEIDANGQMVYPEGKAGMMDLGWAAASMAYWPNVMLCKTWYYEDPNQYENMKAKNLSADKSLALGFTFDASSVADEITACANVIAQYYMPLMYAEVDIDSTLPVFQQALRDAGVDKIVAEKQAQLDAWLAAQ